MNRRRLVTLLCSLIVTVSAVVGGALMLFSDKNTPNKIPVEAATTGALYDANGDYRYDSIPVEGGSYNIGFTDGSMWTCIKIMPEPNGGYGTAIFSRNGNLQNAYYAYDSISWADGCSAGSGCNAGYGGSAASANCLNKSTVYNLGYVSSSYTLVYGAYGGSVATAGGNIGPGTANGYAGASGGNGDIRKVVRDAMGVIPEALKKNVISGGDMPGADLSIKYTTKITNVGTGSMAYKGSEHVHAKHGTEYVKSYWYRIDATAATINSSLEAADLFWLPSHNQWTGWGSPALGGSTWLRGGSPTNANPYYYSNKAANNTTVASSHNKYAKEVRPCVAMKLPKQRNQVDLDWAGGSGIATEISLADSTRAIYPPNANLQEDTITVDIPTKMGHTFTGYYVGGKQIINASGGVGSDTWYRTDGNKLTAGWSRNPLAAPQSTGGTVSSNFLTDSGQYIIIITPGRGYKVNSASLSGAYAKHGAWSSYDVGWPDNENVISGLYVEVTSSGGATLTVTFAALTLTLKSEDRDINSGRTHADPTKGTGPPYSITVTPQNGFHIESISADKGRGVNSGDVFAGKKTTNDAALAVAGYAPSEGGTKVTATLHKNQIGAIDYEEEQGSVTHEEGAVPGAWNIIATPKLGYRVTKISSIDRSGNDYGAGRFTIFYNADWAHTTVEAGRAITYEKKENVDNLSSGLIDSTTSTKVVIQCVLQNDDVVIRVEFTPNDMDKDGVTKAMDTYGNTGAGGVHSWLNDATTGLTKYTLTATPNPGYRVHSIELTNATSDINPINGNDSGSSISMLYSCGTTGSGWVGDATGVTVWVRPSTHMALVTITFAKNIVNYGTMTDENGVSVARLEGLDKVGSGRTNQSANISWKNGNSHGNTNDGTYTVVVVPPAGYRIKNISLSNNAGGMPDIGTTNNSGAISWITTSVINTVSDYGNTQAAMEVTFHSKRNNVDLNIIIARNIIDMYGTEDSLLTINDSPNNSNIESTIGKYRNLGQVPFPPDTTLLATKYEYMRGYVYVANSQHHNYSSISRYVIYAEAKPGYYVGKVQMQGNTVGWFTRGGDYTEMRDSYYKYNITYNKDKALAYYDALIPSKNGEELKVEFWHNDASIRNVIFAGAVGDFPNSTTDKRSDTTINIKTDGLSTDGNQDNEGNAIGSVVMAWDPVRQQYNIDIVPAPGYALSSISVRSDDSGVVVYQNSLKTVNDSYDILSDGYNVYPKKTQTVKLALVPNAHQMTVFVKFRALYAKLGQPMYGTLSLDTWEKNNSDEKMGAPYYVVTAIPNPGYHLTQLYVDLAAMKLDSNLDIPNQEADNMETQIFDAFNPKYGGNKGANSYSFKATYENIIIMARFVKNTIAIRDLDLDDTIVSHSVENGGSTILTNGTVKWDSRSGDNFITLTVTPDPGWRIALNGIQYTAFTDSEYTVPAELPGQEAGQNPAIFNVENDYSTNPYYVQNVGFMEFTDYSSNSARIVVRFCPWWNNGVISVQFTWNDIQGGPGERVPENGGGKVVVEALSDVTDSQRIIFTPLSGYRIQSITMTRVNEAEAVENVDGIYLSTTDLDMTMPAGGWRDNTITGIGRLPLIDGVHFQNYSHIFIIFVRPYWNNAKIDVVFVRNESDIAAMDETKTMIGNFGVSKFGTVESTAVDGDNGVISGENGVSYRYTAKPNAGYKFAGWAVYLTGTTTEFNWADYYDTPDAWNKQIMNISQINDGALTGLGWVPLTAKGAALHERDRDIVLRMGKFAKWGTQIDNTTFPPTPITTIEGFFQPDFIYRRVDNLLSYGGHLAYDYETNDTFGNWMVKRSDYNDAYTGPGDANYKSDRTLPQTIYFTPQYNGLTLVAMFEILTPTILEAPKQAYPIYNGEEQELLIPATTQSWAEVQYGYLWSDQLAIDNYASRIGGYAPKDAIPEMNEIFWTDWKMDQENKFVALMPTRANVVYMEADVGKGINGYRVQGTDIDTSKHDDNKVINEIIFYRAIHLQKIEDESDPAEGSRPTEFVTYGENIEIYSDDYNRYTYNDGNPLLSKKPTPRIDDVRVLPLPISFFFGAGYDDNDGSGTIDEDDFEHNYNEMLHGGETKDDANDIRAGIERNTDPDKLELTYTVAPTTKAHGGQYYDNGTKKESLIGMHDTLENPAQINNYSAMQTWLNEKVLVDPVPGREKRMPGPSSGWQTFNKMGWDARSETSIMMSIVEWNQQMATTYENIIKLYLTNTPESPQINDGEWASIAQLLLEPTANATVMYEKFIVTGAWSDYKNNMPLNGTTARGNFRATGNFAGYLYSVNSFIISDQAAYITYRGLNTDEILEDNPTEDVYGVDVVQLGKEIKYIKPDPTEYTKKYEYTFLGLSRTLQDWSIFANQDEVTAEDLKNKGVSYLENEDWGLDENGNDDPTLPNKQVTSVDNPNDRAIIYHAVYTRKLREYKITFTYKKVGANNRFETSSVSDLAPITKIYNDKFYEDEAYDIEYKDGKKILTPKWNIVTDINNGEQRIIFESWWNLSESYWHTEGSGETARRYFIVEHSWSFSAIYKEYVMIHGGS